MKPPQASPALSPPPQRCQGTGCGLSTLRAPPLALASVRLGSPQACPSRGFAAPPARGAELSVCVWGEEMVPGSCQHPGGPHGVPVGGHGCPRCHHLRGRTSYDMLQLEGFEPCACEGKEHG